MIKVYRLGDRGMEVEEVNLQETQRLVEIAHGRGSQVVNIKEARVIYEVTPAIEELLIIDTIGGG